MVHSSFASLSISCKFSVDLLLSFSLFLDLSSITFDIELFGIYKRFPPFKLKSVMNELFEEMSYFKD